MSLQKPDDRAKINAAKALVTSWRFAVKNTERTESAFPTDYGAGYRAAWTQAADELDAVLSGRKKQPTRDFDNCVKIDAAKALVTSWRFAIKNTERAESAFPTDYGAGYWAAWTQAADELDAVLSAK
jgi:inorganic pyrophosphatase